MKTRDTTMSTVLQFRENSLGCQVSPSDISIAHRLPSGKHDKTPPVMVRFTSRRTRDVIYVARRNLFTAGIKDIYINEHLTKHHERHSVNVSNFARTNGFIVLGLGMA